MEKFMSLVGKRPNQRRRVSVVISPIVNAQIAIRIVPSTQQVAIYLAEMCAELVVMAKGANLPFVAHLLRMAQAEAAYVAESVA